MTRRLASFRLIQRLCAILALCNIQLISSSSSSSTVSASIISAKPQQHEKIFKPSKRTIVSGFGAHSTKHSIFATTQATTSSSSTTSKTSKKASKKEQSKSKPAKEEESIIGPKLNLGNKSLLVYKQDTNGSNNDVDQPPTDSVIWLMDETNQKVCIWVNENGDWMAEVVVEDTAAAANQGQISQPTPPTSSCELNGWTPVEGLYGFYKVPTGILLVLIVKTQNVFEAPPLRSLSDWWRIDKVQHLEVVHLSNAKAQRQLSPIQIKEEIRQLRLLRKAWKQHDFYCCQYDKCEGKISDEDSRASPIVRDMTKSLQSSFLAHQNKKSLNNKKWWTANPDPRFFWNQVAVEPILAKCVSEGMNLEENPSLMDPCTRFLLDHTIPVTSAFVGVQSNITCDDESSSKSYYTQLLISRRSRFRAGTRFTRRGADANGAVANYAETEQVLLLLRNDTGIDKIASHVQTRGSIPIRWSSPADVKTYRPKVHIGTDPLAQARALRWHLLEQQAHYVLLDESKKGKKTNNDAFEMVFVNLVDKKSDQGRLGKAFDEVLQAVLEVHNNSTDATKRGPLVKHVWYDFHAEVKNGKWDRLSNLLKDIEPNLNAHNYLVVSPKIEKRKSNNKASMTEYQIESKQTSVVRTNCMDCLDRTNVVQSIFGRYILFDQLLTKEMDPKTTKTLQKQFQKSKQMSLPWPQSEISHRSLWADNADAISRLYAGTPALKRDFTRTGQRTKLGALDDGMNSLQRYYLNNFMDADRQEGMDLMVGYASFSNIGSTITSRLLLENDDEEDNEGESIFETRRSFLGGLFQPQQQLSNDIEKDATKHEDEDEEEEDDDIKDALDLRWVPGDLQEHLRSRLEGGKDSGKARDSKRGGLLPKLKFGFSSTRALKAMDERSISDLPWWYLEEENVEDNDAKVAKDDDATVDWLEKLGPHQRHPTLTPGMVLSVLVLGFRAPMAMAKGIFSLVGLLYLQDVLSLDWKIVQDVMVELEMRLAALKEHQNDKDSLTVPTSSHDSDDDDDKEEEEEEED